MQQRAQPAEHSLSVVWLFFSRFFFVVSYTIYILFPVSKCAFGNFVRAYDSVLTARSILRDDALVNTKNLLSIALPSRLVAAVK